LSDTSTTTAGNINQTTLGFFNFPMKSSSDDAPIAPSAANSFTASALRS
jgi:hypothetical protein